MANPDAEILTGAASAAFDVAGEATGNQTSFVSTLTGASVTPSAAGELVLCQLGNHYNTVTGTSGSGFIIVQQEQLRPRCRRRTSMIVR